MPPLELFNLPLSSPNPPDGYGWKETNISDTSSTTAFNTGVNNRDSFLGKARCVICGRYSTLDHCHIIPKADKRIWNKLKSRGWIPDCAKDSPEHEPRDGFLLCANHHQAFEQYNYFIRFIPSAQKFVFINYGGLDDAHLHGKAIALDAHHHYAVFPSSFIIHECRVRGFHPFQPVEIDLQDDVPWQDWILADGVIDQKTDSLIHERRQGGTLPRTGTVTQRDMRQQSGGTTNDKESGQRNTLQPLNDETIAEILAFTRSMPSWKACEVEGTSWDGTAEENIKKYVQEIGVEL